MLTWIPESVISKVTLDMNTNEDEKIEGTGGGGQAAQDLGLHFHRRNNILDFFARLVKEKPLGALGGVIVLILLLTGIFADFLAPYGMNETNAGDNLLGPTFQYLLGTDNLGRDMLSRVIYGARISLVVSLSAASISTVISVFLGIICGYFGGKVDMVIQRFVEAIMCIPGLVLLIVVMSMLGPGLLQIILVIGIQSGITGSRVARGITMSVKENVYVEAAVSIGASTSRIMFRHILPNILAPVIIMFTTRMPGIILMEASLSFLGYGIPPPAPSWGGMLSGTGRNYMFLNPYLVIWPGLALSIVVYGINMFGDAVRDLLDPRLRGGLGKYGGMSQEKLQKFVEKKRTELKQKQLLRSE